jgi:two-component system nitrogen regulation response regulator NtrX
MSGRILIVDDEKDIVEAVSNILELEGYSTLKEYRGYDCIKTALGDNPDVVILDIKMPVMDGLDTLKELKKKGFANPVIIISGHGDVKTAVEAVRLGAFDFLEKPLSQDSLLLTVSNAFESKETTAEQDALKFSIIGQSEKFLNCLNIAKRVSKTTAPVLITGETGTGKEVMASFIHKVSGRKGKFVEVNCAAIPEDLIESELFGHKKGAFTGAIADKEGKFVAAHNGTLFLDEIGDMSLKTQAKVLRALQEKIIYPVGSNSPITVNVRVISATNKNLEEEIKAGNFREDLFYRLNVIELKLPSLRERTDDIPLLINKFALIAGKENGMGNVTFSKEACNYLKKMEFKGNIRELKNLVERIVVITGKNNIEKEAVISVLNNKYKIEEEIPYLETEENNNENFKGKYDYVFDAKSLKEFRELSEREFLIKKIVENKFNLSKTAEHIETPRSNLYKKIDQFNIDIKELEKIHEK